MKDEYDFSNAARGMFFRPGAKVHIMPDQTINVKIFVAAYGANNGYVIWASHQAVHDDCREVSPHVGDLFWNQTTAPPDRGLWVFEGTMHRSALENELDVSYSGTWRRAQPDEAARAIEGNPFE